ncbi:hypothetical protein YC2023_107073 [Brassica napus]
MMYPKFCKRFPLSYELLFFTSLTNFIIIYSNKSSENQMAAGVDRCRESTRISFPKFVRQSKTLLVLYMYVLKSMFLRDI